LIFLFNFDNFVGFSDRRKKLDGYAIKIKDLSKNYGKTTVLKGLDADFKSGAVTAVIGPNGSGKTTLFKILLGISNSDKGEVTKAKESKIGFMLENFKPYERLNLVDNLKAFSRLCNKCSMSRAYIKEILSFSFCEKFKFKKFGSLSAGQQRKFLFALSLVGEPEIVVLDEPLNSLDLKERIDMTSSIKYLKETRGTTIIVSSHDLSGLYDLCDEFFFLKDGRFIRSMNKADFEKDSINGIYLDIYK
jgi:ABC-type multidrug transport system ATPase subunit